MVGAAVTEQTRKNAPPTDTWMTSAGDNQGLHSAALIFWEIGYYDIKIFGAPWDKKTVINHDIFDLVSAFWKIDSIKE